jgi:tRNA nucleotidyltransferase/poly(A) polymerase
MGGLIRRHGDSLLACSRERVTEEVYKILASGAAADILELAHKLRLFDVLFPSLADAALAGRKKFAETGLAERLRALDAATREGRPLARDSMFGFLFRDLVLEREDVLMDPDPGLLVQRFIRTASEPLFPSKKDLAVAAETLLKEAGWQPPPPPEARERAPGEAHRGRRKRRRRRRGPPRALPA